VKCITIVAGIFFFIHLVNMATAQTGPVYNFNFQNYPSTSFQSVPTEQKVLKKVEEDSANKPVVESSVDRTENNLNKWAVSTSLFQQQSFGKYSDNSKLLRGMEVGLTAPLSLNYSIQISLVKYFENLTDSDYVAYDNGGGSESPSKRFSNSYGAKLSLWKIFRSQGPVDVVLGPSLEVSALNIKSEFYHVRAFNHVSIDQYMYYKLLMNTGVQYNLGHLNLGIIFGLGHATATPSHIGNIKNFFNVLNIMPSLGFSF